jgi:hypothetical protein
MLRMKAPLPLTRDSLASRLYQGLLLSLRGTSRRKKRLEGLRQCCMADETDRSNAETIGHDRVDLARPPAEIMHLRAGLLLSSRLLVVRLIRRLCMIRKRPVVSAEAASAKNVLHEVPAGRAEACQSPRRTPRCSSNSACPRLIAPSSRELTRLVSPRGAYICQLLPGFRRCFDHPYRIALRSGDLSFALTFPLGCSRHGFDGTGH